VQAGPRVRHRQHIPLPLVQFDRPVKRLNGPVAVAAQLEHLRKVSQRACVRVEEVAGLGELDGLTSKTLRRLQLAPPCEDLRGGACADDLGVDVVRPQRPGRLLGELPGFLISPARRRPSTPSS
jgi:hypothetical protein